ncbi:MAG: YtxH domain-containing protein [Gemmatimonadaceae bacterium]
MYTTPADPPDSPRRTALRPLGKPYKSVPDLKSVSMLGIGLVIGSVLGAGIALLTAPQTGEDTRASLSRRARRIRGQPVGAWERLGRELKRAAALKQKERRLAAAGRETASEKATVEPKG